MNTLSTHVLDTSLGRPASGLTCVLSRWESEGWMKLVEGVTNDDGRIPNFIPEGVEITRGKYKMRFATKEYHEKMGIEGFYPVVKVIFQIKTDNEHYHIPLLLSPFGYSTYRGS